MLISSSCYTNIYSKYLPQLDFTAHGQENFSDKTFVLIFKQCFNLFKINIKNHSESTGQNECIFHSLKEMVFGAFKKSKMVLVFFVLSGFTYIGRRRWRDSLLGEHCRHCPWNQVMWTSEGPSLFSWDGYQTKSKLASSPTSQFSVYNVTSSSIHHWDPSSRRIVLKVILCPHTSRTFS